jgi:hypothetical protein
MSVSARYGEALLWAEQIHRDQRRKGKAIPYISHLISVSALVWEDGGTEDQAIARGGPGAVTGRFHMRDAGVPPWGWSCIRSLGSGCTGGYPGRPCRPLSNPL